MAVSTLTQSRLKEVLRYDPDTGAFTWIARIRGMRIGSRAGCLHTSNTTGYRHIFIRVDQQLYKAHRLAWLYVTGAWPDHEVDHEDHDGTNNKWLNLRAATHAQNHQNISKPKDNSSGVVGVCWHKRYSKWMARIQVNRKGIFLGCFHCFDDAVKARKEAEIQYGFHKNHGT